MTSRLKSGLVAALAAAVGIVCTVVSFGGSSSMSSGAVTKPLTPGLAQSLDSAGFTATPRAGQLEAADSARVVRAAELLAWTQHPRIVGIFPATFTGGVRGSTPIRNDSVWVVVFRGVRVPIFGPSVRAAELANSYLSNVAVVVDAKSSDPILATSVTATGG